MTAVWWINYYEHGKQRREKVGRKSDAIKLYQQRRADIQRGHKLPPLRRTSPVMINDLVDLMLEHVRNQSTKTCARMKVAARWCAENWDRETQKH